MANWAFTSYAIEGPKEDLQKIEQAILNHDIKEGSDASWEGNILNALGIEWPENFYMRGFTSTNPWWDCQDTVLRFDAEEAWGATDFNEALEMGFPDIKVYYSTEEPGCAVFATNDREGKYFFDRYSVDTCIEGEYYSDYFTEEESVYKWLSEITKGKVSSKEDVETFNESWENSEDEENNWIHIEEFEIVD